MAKLCDHRVQDLEGAVDKMRQQQDLLQRRLKEEQENKIKLEVHILT